MNNSSEVNSVGSDRSVSRLPVNWRCGLGHGDCGAGLFDYVLLLLHSLLLSFPLFRKINSHDYPITMALLIQLQPHVVVVPHISSVHPAIANPYLIPSQRQRWITHRKTDPFPGFFFLLLKCVTSFLYRPPPPFFKLSTKMSALFSFLPENDFFFLQRFSGCHSGPPTQALSCSFEF